MTFNLKTMCVVPVPQSGKPFRFVLHWLLTNQLSRRRGSRSGVPPAERNENMKARPIDPEQQNPRPRSRSAEALARSTNSGDRPFLQVGGLVNDSDLLMVGAHTLGAQQGQR